MLTLGNYHIVAELGRGGSAEVHLAVQCGPMGSGFSKLAVVKRLRADVADDPEFAAMLVDEARITARVRHPNIVQTFEVGLDGDVPFLTMEYLDGLPLHLVGRRAASRGIAIDRDVALLVIVDALAGLQHAHELVDYDGTPLAVVHRDLTPHNVFVTVDGAVKVVDFGIAQAVGRVVETRHGVVKGKIRYMAPEQASALPVDRRADIFSAGVILWESLTGKRFWGKRDELDVVESLVRHAYDASPRSVDQTIPESLDAICRKALAPEPAGRYGTAAEMRADLEAYLGERIIGARRALGPLVTTLFEEDRKKIRALVERTVKTVSHVSERLVIAPRTSAPIDNAPSVGPFIAADEVEVTLEAPRATSDDPTKTRQPAFVEAPRPTRSRWATMFDAVAVAAFVLVAFVAAHGDRVATGASPTAPRMDATTSRAELVLSSGTSVRPRIEAAPDVLPSAPPRAPAAHPARSRRTPLRPAAPVSANPTSKTSSPPPLRIDASDPWTK